VVENTALGLSPFSSSLIARVRLVLGRMLHSKITVKLVLSIIHKLMVPTKNTAAGKFVYSDDIRRFS
jgi:hypothetical protein